MKYLLKFTFILSFTFLLSSMTVGGKEKVSAAGCYGDCTTENQKTKLILKEDNTFHYIDNSYSKSPVDIHGKWEQKGNTIVLETSDKNPGLRKKWKLKRNGMCLSSRKAALFFDPL